MSRHALRAPVSGRALALQRAGSRCGPRPFSSSRPCRRLRVANELPALALDWTQVKAQTSDALSGYTLRTGQAPSSSPSAVLPTAADSHLRSTKPLVLFRDTNAWCPYCQRVWFALEHKGISYDTIFIDLRDKPTWYKDVVPTTKVPAVSLAGKVFWESKDILLLLEDLYPNTPLLPPEGPARKEAMEVLEETDAAPWVSAGFALLTAGAPNPLSQDGRDESKVPELRVKLQEQFQRFEELLGAHEGPFLLGNEISLPDVMLLPSMERLAAGLTNFRSFSVDANPDFPRAAAWYSALRALPAYSRTGSDSTTHHLVFGKRVNLEAAHDLSGLDDATIAARKEGAGKVATNKAALTRDILKNSGLTRFRGSPYGRTVVSPNGYDGEVHPLIQDAVDWTLLRLSTYLLTGKLGPRPSTADEACVQATTLAYLRSRICAPRDMSARSAEQMRAACDVLLANLY